MPTASVAPAASVFNTAPALPTSVAGRTIPQGLRSLVADREKVLTLTDQLKVKGEAPVGDPKAKGRKYDTKYRLSLDRKGLKLEGDLVSRRVHDRNAVVERLPWAQRNIAQMFAGNPVIYRMEGDANLVLTVEGQEPVTLTGTALMESIVN